MSVRDKIEDEERKTVRALLSERAARRREEHQAQEKAKKKAAQNKRLKKLEEVREKRSKAEKKQRMDRYAKVQPIVDNNLRVAYRAMRVAVAAAESVRINKYTDEGRTHRKQVEGLRNALEAVRRAGGQSSLSEPNVDSPDTDMT